MIEIIGVLVAAGDGEHAGAQNVLSTVRHQQRVAWISTQRRKAPGEADGPLDGSQQHHPIIRAPASAVECSNDFLAFDGWEVEGQKRIVRYGG
jgi:hypothetical protein